MKNLLKLFSVVSLIIITFFLLNTVNSVDFGTTANPNINIDDCGWNCDSIVEWISLVKDEVNSIYTDKSFSEKVQDIVLYLIWFVSFIAILYIIYAWFMILTWAWEEEKLKKAKTIIYYVTIWIILIWLAYPVVMFIIGTLVPDLPTIPAT